MNAIVSPHQILKNERRQVRDQQVLLQQAKNQEFNKKICQSLWNLTLPTTNDQKIMSSLTKSLTTDFEKTKNLDMTEEIIELLDDDSGYLDDSRFLNNEY